MKEKSLVACVYDKWFATNQNAEMPEFPRKNEIYTVSSVVYDGHFTWISLEEIPPGRKGEHMFDINGFREVQTAIDGSNILQLMMEDTLEDQTLQLFNQTACLHSFK